MNTGRTLLTMALLLILTSAAQAEWMDECWKLSADAVFLKRERPDSLVLMHATADPTRHLNADDFDFGYQAGWDVSLRRAVNDCWSVEGRFLSVDDWTATTTAVTDTTLLLPLRINTNPPVFAPFVRTINAAYDSELQSAELNLWRPAGDFFRLLAGFRYVELDEQLRAQLVTPAPTFLYNIDTQNRFYGIQVGGDASLLCRGRLSLDGLAKAGIFHNVGAHTSSLDTTRVTIAASQDSNRVTFIGELGLKGVFALTDQLSLRGGYSFLWIESAVLASNQIPVTNYATGSGINNGGDILYHGAFVGLELSH